MPRRWPDRGWGHGDRLVGARRGEPPGRRVLAGVVAGLKAVRPAAIREAFQRGPRTGGAAGSRWGRRG